MVGPCHCPAGVGRGTPRAQVAVCVPSFAVVQVGLCLHQALGHRTSLDKQGCHTLLLVLPPEAERAAGGLDARSTFGLGEPEDPAQGRPDLGSCLVLFHPGRDAQGATCPQRPGGVALGPGPGLRPAPEQSSLQAATRDLGVFLSLLESPHVHGAAETPPRKQHSS